MRLNTIKMLHNNCRGGIYQSSKVQRFQVPDDKVDWSIDYPEYNPPDYTSSVVVGKPWADLDIDDPSFKPKWNQIDGKINRHCHNGIYKFDDNNRPINPAGRTGIRGRGLLGRWGPNHAADPIVTRWKRDIAGNITINNESKKQILQFIGIKRKDTGEWAIPGGMVDAGEVISLTLKREFMEEALNSIGKTPEQLSIITDSINKLFSNGEEIYKGYVDDPRNTDNSWMETCAMNFHDDDGSLVGSIPLEAGDDASNVRWIDIEQNLNLYANHINFIQLTVEKKKAHW
ncbi:ADP-ribose pyrophosphatase, mitochondrial [Aphidius gifuensis]|nr:ADP-ribose pyrophosphatase, mitochondrial [Aphidius gifuensis]